MIRITARHAIDFLFIPLPKTAETPWIINNGSEKVALNYYLPEKSLDNNKWSEGIVLSPFKSYELVACTDTITEEQADSIVEKMHFALNKPYINYQSRDSPRLWKALDSFVTLLQANGISGKYAILKQV